MCFSRAPLVVVAEPAITRVERETPAIFHCQVVVTLRVLLVLESTLRTEFPIVSKRLLLFRL